MDFESFVPMFLISLIITVLAYLLVPVVLVFSGKQYTEKEIRKIVIINGIVWFVIFFVIRVEQGYENVNFAPCVLWSSVAYSIMKKKCLKTVCENELVDKNISNLQRDITENVVHHVCLSDVNEEQKSYGNLEIKGEDFLVRKTDYFKVDEIQSQYYNVVIDAYAVSKTISEQCAKSLIAINRKCSEIGIEYNDRKLAIATFAYFFVQWVYTSKNISFAQVGEVQKLYKEQFSDFNKVAFQDDSFKSVIENEQIFADVLKKFLGYAKNFYNSENNSFSKEMMEKYISEFIQNESDIAILKEYL